MNTYVDPDGVENIAVGMVKQARNDFIKGGKILYEIFGCIPTYEELIKLNGYKKVANDSKIRWMYDSWRFVNEDPYSMFGDGEAVINSWKTDSITEYYKIIYLKLSPIIYGNKPSDNHIQNLSEEELKSCFDNLVDVSKFMEARNYISKLPNSESIFKEWNSIGRRRRNEAKAFSRLRKSRSEAAKDAYKKRIEISNKRKERAKELYEVVISRQAIAKELGVQLNTVNVYLRS